jgi:hypothetical protein
MTDLERLLARQEIAELRARYFRCTDTKDWTGFAALFAPDAALSFPDDAPDVRLEGREVIVQAVASALTDVVTVHHGHMGEISFTAPDAAHGLWAMEDKLWFGPASPQPGMRLHGYGHYHDRYTRQGGVWLFQEVVLRRLRVDRWLAEKL